MGIIIDPNPVITEGVYTFPEAPVGYQLVTAFAYPDLFHIGDMESVDTVTIDFVSPHEIDQFWLNLQFTSHLIEIAQMGEYVRAYALYKGSEQDISVPNEITLGGLTWTPPFAGQTVSSMFRYRLWVAGTTLTGAQAMHVRGVWPLAVVITVIIGAILGTVVISGLIMLLLGRISWQQLLEGVKSIFRLPGENIQPLSPSSLTGPLFAFGIAIVAAGIFIPTLQSKIEAKIPIGGGGIGGSAGFGGGGGRRR